MVVLNALSGSMILILNALGLGLIFGQMGVLNLAHGEFFMLGAYMAVLNNSLGLKPVVGLVLAPIAVGLYGLVIERTIINKLYERTMDTLLVTWGLSMVMKQFVRILFGAGHQNVKALVTGSTRIFGIDYPVYRLFIIGITIVLLIVVLLIYYNTKYGLRIRMVISNRQQSMAMGVNTSRVDGMTFALGSALAGLAGAIMTPLMFISPEMGGGYLTSAFIIVIIGGVSSILGLIGGGVVYGVSNTMIDFIVRNTFLTNIIVLLLAIVIIRLRPRGLFSRST